MATAAAAESGLSPEPLMQIMQGLEATAILQAGVHLGVFDALAEGKDDVKSVSARIGASERGTRILLDALSAFGLVEADGGYKLTPLAEAFLVTGRPSYLGGMVNILAGDWAWTGYPRLADAVREGRSVLEQDAETPEHSFWETFARSSPGIATPASHALAEALAPWAESRETLDVLDIACGSGLFGLTIAERFQHVQLTLLDWPNVLAITRGTVEQKGLLDRTSFVEGDVFGVPLGGPYDLVVASHIFHHFSEERCLELLRRLSSALKPGGRLAINEFSADAPVSEEPFPRLFSIIMLVWTQAGEAYPVETYRRWLEATGFSPPEVHQSPGMPSRFLIAERV
jgi:ubiquinone/menaquinone biosynthesis C-methylase UbiE